MWTWPPPHALKNSIRICIAPKWRIWSAQNVPLCGSKTLPRSQVRGAKGVFCVDFDKDAQIETVKNKRKTGIVSGIINVINSFSLFHISGCPSRVSNSGLPCLTAARLATCGLRRHPDVMCLGLYMYPDPESRSRKYGEHYIWFWKHKLISSLLTYILFNFSCIL